MNDFKSKGYADDYVMALYKCARKPALQKTAEKYAGRWKLVSGLYPAVIPEKAKTVGDALSEIIDSGKGCSFNTLPDALEKRGALNAIGGVENARTWVAQAELADPSHLSILWDEMVKALKRHDIESIPRIVTTEAQRETPIESIVEIIKDTQRRSDGLEKKNALTISEMFDAEIEALANREPPVPTGFQMLDDMLHGGLHQGGYVLVAGRPAMGKTAFCLNMAMAGNAPCSYYSYEMTSGQMAMRVMAIASGVPVWALKNPTADQLSDMNIARESSAHIRMRSIDSHEIRDLDALDAQIRTDAREGCRVMYIDYIGLIAPPKNQMLVSREQQIATISRRIRDLTIKHKITIVGVCQLNRNVEKRENKDKKPQMSDLRDSGSLEQDCDMAMLLYRPDYYEIETARSKPFSEGVIGLAKSRYGGTGEVPIEFHKAAMQFRQGRVKI